jgi:CheY-like chemotaxis protein
VANVLVIEDDPSVRRVVCRVLEGAGHATLEAGNGREGVTLVIRVRPDLVITDLLMPEQEGMETIHQIKDFDATIPIIAISTLVGDGEYSPLSDARMLGADLSLEKPFAIEALLAAVNELLGRPRTV